MVPDLLGSGHDLDEHDEVFLPGQDQPTPAVDLSEGSS